MKVTVKSHVCVCAGKLKNMFKKSEKTVCRMKRNHRFQNICSLYKGMSGRSELTEKLKYKCEHIRFGKTRIS